MPQRLLVVEDNPTLLKMIRRRLEHAGYEVLVAVTGAEALTRLKQPERIDLVLLDLHQSGLDGFDLCQRLKADPVGAAIPVILVTAAEAYLDRLPGLCRALGATDYIGKPFRSVDLLKKITDVLSQAARGPQPTTAPLTPVQAPGGSAGRSRVLVVDDDPRIPAYFAQILPSPEFEVVGVGSGQEALGVIQGASCALAVVDIIMPGWDGLQTLKALRAEQPELPVIMMTSYEVEDLVALALTFGAVHCLRKPFEHASSIVSAVQQAKR